MPELTPDFIVHRLRFTARGELLDESVFATERELAGIKEQHGRLPLDAPPATQPLETAGPLLAHLTEGEPPCPPPSSK